MAPRLTNPHTWTKVGWRLFQVALFGHVFVRYVGGIGQTSGVSMVPTMPHGFSKRTCIMYSSLHRRGRGIKVGDVITYTHPIFPERAGCKRVIGMPGDFVSVVTPGRVNEEDLKAEDTENKWASIREQVIQVPEGHCWVAGDNLEWSRDSRLYGPLPLGLVTSKVLAVVLPMADAKWLGAEYTIKDAQGTEHEWVTPRGRG